MSEQAPTFEQFVASLTRLSAPARLVAAAARQPFEEAAAALKALDPVDRSTVETLVGAHPDWVPILASVVGLSQEQLKRFLRHRLDTESWNRAARERSGELVALLDDEYGLVEQILA